MSLNAGKYHSMCLGKDTGMKNIKEQKILGVTIDNKLTFKSHIKNLCKKISQKIGALSKLSNHLDDSQKKLVLNSIVKSQFNYCPLIWMFWSRTSNKTTNKYIRGHWEWYIMTMKVILVHYCKIIMTFETIIETFRQPWSKPSKLKKVSLTESWDLSLKGKITLITLVILRNFRQKEKNCIFWFRNY